MQPLDHGATTRRPLPARSIPRRDNHPTTARVTASQPARSEPEMAVGAPPTARQLGPSDFYTRDAIIEYGRRALLEPAAPGFGHHLWAVGEALVIPA